MSENHRIAVPRGCVIVQIQAKGDKAAFHAERHGEKLSKHMLDCGLDIFPSGISKIDHIESKAAGLFLGGKPVWNIVYVATKVHLCVAPGWFLMLHSRSSTPMAVPSAEMLHGIIDSGYTGEILIRFKCHGSLLAETTAFIEEAIAKEKALAQVIPLPFGYPQFMLLTDSGIIAPLGGRGDAGFGSTDRK